MNDLDIKNIRKKLKKNQTEFGKMIGVTKRTIINYEKGTEIPSSKVKLIHLLINSKKDSESEALVNTNGNKFIEKEDGSFNITVKLMPFDAYASHVESLEDVNLITDWEEVTFNVEKYGRGNYQAFKVKGDSMNGGMLNDTPDGAMVLGRELNKQHWIDGFKPTMYGWIILSRTNIFHKDIIDFNKNTGEIICHSRNDSPEYSDFSLKIDEVYQIFKVIKRTF